MNTRVEIWTRQGEAFDIITDINPTGENTEEWLSKLGDTSSFGVLSNEKEKLFIRGDAIAAIKFTTGEQADGEN